MHRKQKSILLSFGPWPEIRTKYRTHVPSRDFQLHFCQSLAGLSNEESVDQGDSSHSHQLVPIQNQSKTGLAHWYAVDYIPLGLYAWRPTASKMSEDNQKLRSGCPPDYQIFLGKYFENNCSYKFFKNFILTLSFSNKLISFWELKTKCILYGIKMRATKYMSRTTRFQILVVPRLPTFNPNFATLSLFLSVDLSNIYIVSNESQRCFVWNWCHYFDTNAVMHLFKGRLI